MSLNIATLPDKLTYYDGEPIDITGLVVTYNGVVVPHSDLIYTQVAYPPNGFTARSDSIIYTAGTVFSEGDDPIRQPVWKYYNYLGAFMIGYDAGGDDWGGNWFLYASLGINPWDGSFRGSENEYHTINRLRYALNGRACNINYNGATYATNPLGLPTTNGVQWFTPNRTWTDENVLKLVKFLNFRYNGGAVTIEYNGDFIQYGITIGERPMYVGVSNLPRKVKKFYVGVNGVPKRVIKGYVGVNNEPKLFWGEPTRETWDYSIATKDATITVISGITIKKYDVGFAYYGLWYDEDRHNYGILLLSQEEDAVKFQVNSSSAIHGAWNPIQDINGNDWYYATADNASGTPTNYDTIIGSYSHSSSIEQIAAEDLLEIIVRT